VTIRTFRARPTNDRRYLVAAAVMGAAVVLACAPPAWRAASVDPSVALRQDG
jgi:ABC-type antimicrobial peptide transport system permease subunit